MGYPNFYYIDSSTGTIKQLDDLNRLAIMKRTYNDGSVSIVFYDYATNTLAYPQGVQFNSNVVENPARPGEYILRNGGSTNGSDPSNILFNSLNPEYAMSVMASSVTSGAGNQPPPDPSKTTQKTYNTTQLGKLAFRFMQGNSSIIYHGDIVVKQIQLPDGGYALIFQKPDGTELQPSTIQGSKSVDIQSLYKIKNVNGVERRVLYISPGGGTGFQWLESNYSGSPPAQPPSILPHTVHYATNSIKFLLIDANGQVYSGDNFNVRYYYNPNNGQYQITFQDSQGGALSLRGDGTPQLLNGRYQMKYEQGKSFADQFQEEFSGSAPQPPPPQPPPELNKIEIHLVKGQTAIEAFNWDGHTSTPALTFTIHIEEQSDGSYQVYATGGSSDPNHNVGGRLWVNLTYTGLKLNRLDNGNWELPADRVPPGATAPQLQDWFMQSYHKDPTPEPGPRPPKPTQPGIYGDPINVTGSKFDGVRFLNADGTEFRGSISLYWLNQTSIEGKNLFQFVDQDGNPLEIDVNHGYTANIPEEYQDETGARRLQGSTHGVEYESNEPAEAVYDDTEEGFNGRRVNPRPIIPIGGKALLDSLILYRDEMEIWGSDTRHFNPKGLIVGFVKLDPDYKKKEKENAYFNRPTLLDPNDPVPDDPGVADPGDQFDDPYHPGAVAPAPPDEPEPGPRPPKPTEPEPDDDDPEPDDDRFDDEDFQTTQEGSDDRDIADFEEEDPHIRERLTQYANTHKDLNDLLIDRRSKLDKLQKEMQSVRESLKPKPTSDDYREEFEVDPEEAIGGGGAQMASNIRKRIPDTELEERRRREAPHLDALQSEIDAVEGQIRYINEEMDQNEKARQGYIEIVEHEREKKKIAQEEARVEAERQRAEKLREKLEKLKEAKAKAEAGSGSGSGAEEPHGGLRGPGRRLLGIDDDDDDEEEPDDEPEPSDDRFDEPEPDDELSIEEIEAQIQELEAELDGHKQSKIDIHRKRFDLYDKDKNGHLDIQEIIKHILDVDPPEEIPDREHAEKVAQQIMEEADTDKSGDINFEEYYKSNTGQNFLSEEVTEEFREDRDKLAEQVIQNGEVNKDSKIYKHFDKMYDVTTEPATEEEVRKYAGFAKVAYESSPPNKIDDYTRVDIRNVWDNVSMYSKIMNAFLTAFGQTADESIEVYENADERIISLKGTSSVVDALGDMSLLAKDSELVKVLEDMMKNIKTDKKTTYVGHSYGGYLAEALFNSLDEEDRKRSRVVVFNPATAWSSTLNKKKIEEAGIAEFSDYSTLAGVMAFLPFLTYTFLNKVIRPNVLGEQPLRRKKMTMVMAAAQGVIGFQAFILNEMLKFQNNVKNNPYYYLTNTAEHRNKFLNKIRLPKYGGGTTAVYSQKDDLLTNQAFSEDSGVAAKVVGNTLYPDEHTFVSFALDNPTNEFGEESVLGKHSINYFLNKDWIDKTKTKPQKPKQRGNLRGDNTEL
jgi:hypothetical protein